MAGRRKVTWNKEEKSGGTLKISKTTCFRKQASNALPQEVPWIKRNLGIFQSKLTSHPKKGWRSSQKVSQLEWKWKLFHNCKHEAIIWTLAMLTNTECWIHQKKNLKLQLYLVCIKITKLFFIFGLHFHLAKLLTFIINGLELADYYQNLIMCKYSRVEILFLALLCPTSPFYPFCSGLDKNVSFFPNTHLNFNLLSSWRNYYFFVSCAYEKGMLSYTAIILSLLLFFYTRRSRLSYSTCWIKLYFSMECSFPVHSADTETQSWRCSLAHLCCFSTWFEYISFINLGF